MEWIPVETVFRKDSQGSHPIGVRHDLPLPPPSSVVLVRYITPRELTLAGVAVGYIRHAAGDEKCPYFQVPNAPGSFVVTHWCDCLPDGFRVPGWLL